MVQQNLLMAKEVKRFEGWSIFDRLKNLPCVMAFNRNLRRIPCKMSLQVDIIEDEQESPAPHEQQQLFFLKDNTSKKNKEKLEQAQDDGALTSCDLLKQLQVVAMGIRDFEELKSTYLLGEVKDERFCGKKNTMDNLARSKAKEPLEKKIHMLKKSSDSTLKVVLNASSKVQKNSTSNKSKDKEKLTFLNNYIQTTSELSNITPISKNPNCHVQPQESTNIDNDANLKKPFKATNLITKQQVLSIVCDVIESTKKDARSRELGLDLDKKLHVRKKVKVPIKNIVDQSIHVLPFEKQMLSKAALIEVMAAKELQDATNVIMTKFMDELCSMENENFNDLPLNVTIRWIDVHSKNLCSSFNFHSTIIKHTLISSTKVDI